jgi:flagellar motor switch protein FliG
MKPNNNSAALLANSEFAQLTGIQKSALLLIALDVDSSAELLKNIDADDVEAISAEISQVKNTSSQTFDGVMNEFHNMVKAREYVLEGGIDYARAILEKSFGLNKAVEIIEKVKSITTLKGFDILKKADSTQLVNFLIKEHPQTIALILTHLSPDQTANAISELPLDLRSDVAHRIATLGKVEPQTLRRIEKVVDDLAGLTMSQTVGKIGGTKSLATILNRTKVSLSKEIMDEIMDKDPDVAAEIKRLMFLFEDLINLQDKHIQKILREIDRKDLTLALKTADEELANKIFANMSERASELLKEELQYMGMVRLKEVEAAQARIIDVVKQLEEAGDISLNIQGGTEEVYV